MFAYGWGQGWNLTILSSCLCAAGCFVIFIDDFYALIFPKSITSRFKLELKQNFTFLNGLLGFSAGCLLFTSLFRLLPEASEYIHNSVKKVNGEIEKSLNEKLIISYIIGILICLGFNHLLHLITSESVVHCSHDDGESGHNHEEHEHHTHEEHDDDEENEVANETSPLIHQPHATMGRKTSTKSLIHLLTPSGQEVGECKGYSSAELCLYQHDLNDDENQGEAQDTESSLHYCEIPSLHESIHHGRTSTDHHKHNHDHHKHSHDSSHANPLDENHSQHKHDHHHHISSPLSRLLLIGIQTTLAITLHKFPEGFITFITSETNPELGVSIFISLLFHNFTEGFSMCLPLFYLFTQSSNKKYAKLKAVVISSLLGGLSQPLGALAGWFFLTFYGNQEKIDLLQLNLIFGITLAITSGFLSVVGLSMYGSAVSFSGSLNFVMVWCLLGMSLIGLLTIVSYE